MTTESDIYGIAYSCPKKNRDIDCPLLKIEGLSFKEKIEWINKLDKESQELILRHHHYCTKIKTIKQEEK